jgi:hypothetical protein
MKKIIVQNEEWRGTHFTVFSVPVVKVRKLATISTATRVITAAKGIGAYRRKEKFDKGLTSFI